MSTENNFLDLLQELGNRIPKFSTDFITPEGLDFKKMKETIRGASFKTLLPACSLATDLAGKLFDKSNNMVIKDFISWARNSIALYYVMDNIYNNVQPSNSMENRAEIMFWKEIASKFNTEIPICEHYSGAGAGQVPIGDILLYLTFRMKLKEKYSFAGADGARYEFIIEGAEGNAPTINSVGNIVITSPICILFRCRRLAPTSDNPIVETLYVLKMEKFSTENVDKEGGISVVAGGDGPSKFIGGQILSEHAACTIEHPSMSYDNPVQACLAYIYRKMDTSKYHYYVDSSKIMVKPNDARSDTPCWVCSDLMKKVSDYCTNAARINTSLSYALVGPLGTGKTSTCNHIMDDLASKGFMIINCKLDDRTLDTTLERIMFCINMTQKAVILLDELDSLNISQKCDKVNALIDFFAKVKESQYPTIIFMTINDPLKVHESIMERSGRVDCTFEVDFPNEELLGKLLHNYCGKYNINIPDDVYADAVKQLVANKMSAADVENFSRQIYIENGEKEMYGQEDINRVVNSFIASRKASRKTYYQRPTAQNQHNVMASLD